MKKIFLPFLLLIVLISMATAQNNKVDGNGLRKGEWLIKYKGDFKYYDYDNILLNLEKMLVSEKETNADSETKYFEKVMYEKGVKQGQFVVYSAKAVNGNYPVIAVGEYMNGKLTNKLLIKFQSYNTDYCIYIKYENGIIQDQIVNWLNPTNFNIMYLNFRDQKISPSITIKNGMCVNQITISNMKGRLELYPLKIVKTDTGYKKYTYFSDCTSLYDTGDCLDVSELDNNFNLNGVSSSHRVTNVAFDTTKMFFKATIKNNKYNGIQYWYDDKTSNLRMECNYVDGLLEGTSKLYTVNGQVYVEANYKDGLLDGNYVSYYYKESLPPFQNNLNIIFKSPFCEKNVNVNIFNIAQNNIAQNIFKDFIPKFKNDGHSILSDGDFKFYEATYVGGKMQGNYYYLHSNGKKLYEGVVSDCKEIDWKWIDVNGKIILDKKGLETQKSVAPGHTVTIGSQVWMSKNLDVNTFSNGDPIPEAKNFAEWKSAGDNKQPAWCYYGINVTNGAKYGKLYNWYAVADNRQICPIGWHVPSEAEWMVLIKYLGGEVFAGKKMKSTNGWESYTTKGTKTCPDCATWSTEYKSKVPCHTCKDTRKVASPIETYNGGGSNSSGFQGLPGGYCNSFGEFSSIGKKSTWWSTSKHPVYLPWGASEQIDCYSLDYDTDKLISDTSLKGQGLSVRCIKD